MRVFVCFDGDTIGQMVGRARAADDVEEVRRVNQRIDLGNDIWRAWATNSGGSVIEIGGDEGAVEVPADKLDELPSIREQYQGKVEATVSVGVGMKLSEASKALLAAKLKGKDQIVFYTEDCEKVVAEAQQQTEAQKQEQEYGLNKAAPAMNAGAFAGASQPGTPTIDKPVATQGDHSAGEAIHEVTEASDAPGPAETTHAGRDFENQLHDEAWKGEEEDMARDAQSSQNLDQVKAAVAQALMALKQQAPVLEQMKQQAPQAYAAMTQLAQAVIAMAREVAPQQIQKADSLSSGREPMAKALKAPRPETREQLVHYSVEPGLKQVDVSHMGSGAPAAEYRQGRPEVGRAYYYRAGTKPEHIVTQGAKAVYSAQLDPAKHKLYDVGADPEGLRQPSHDKFLAGEGLESPEDTLLDAVKGKGYYGYFNSSSSMPGVVALFHSHPVKQMAKDEMDPALEKAKLPMPGASARHHVVLPVGSQVDNKVKVQHQDGGVSWKQMSAGAIRSMDPAGHPTSSRSPNSK